MVDPQLTVTMNDDTQFGFIERGASRPLPPGARVGFRSNRPHVVAVDAAIGRVAVDSQLMPLGNATGMTPSEREELGAWIRAGAPIK